MIIYHGHPSQPSLTKCRQLAPSFSHGAEFSDKTGRRLYDEPYIVDNGAYSAFKNGHEWDEDSFREFLGWADEHQRDPDFVVVPDVVGDAEATYHRSQQWADQIEYPTYQPVQDEMGFDEAIEFTIETGSVGIFVGGSKPWKRKTAKRWVKTANEYGLNCHIARPWDLLTAAEYGADSVDTTTIVAWGAWDKLTQLEEQSQIAQYV